jgi:hypothetical protein
MNGRPGTRPRPQRLARRDSHPIRGARHTRLFCRSGKYVTLGLQKRNDFFALFE